MPRGSCLCKAVRYETEGSLEGIDHCHCSMCRRAHGSAFSTYGRVLREKVRVEDPEGALVWYGSSEPVRRGFCGKCGSSLFFRHAAAEIFEFIAVGTLDDDPGARPEAHIFVTSKAPWYTIEDDLPQHDEFPPGMAG